MTPNMHDHRRNPESEYVAPDEITNECALDQLWLPRNAAHPQTVSSFMNGTVFWAPLTALPMD